MFIMIKLDDDYRKALEQQIQWKKQRDLSEKLTEKQWLAEADKKPGFFDTLGTNYRPRTAAYRPTTANPTIEPPQPLMNPYSTLYSNGGHGGNRNTFASPVTPYQSSQLGYNSPFPFTSKPLMPYNGYQPSSAQIPAATLAPVRPTNGVNESSLEAQLRQDLARQVEENKRRKQHEDEIKKMEELKDQLRIEADLQKIRLEFEEEQRRRLMEHSNSEARRAIALNAARVKTPPLRHLPHTYSTPTLYSSPTPYTSDPPLRSLSPPIPTLRNKSGGEEPKYVRYEPTAVVRSTVDNPPTQHHQLESTPSPVFGSRLEPFPNNQYTNPSPVINLAISRPATGQNWHNNDIPLHHAIAAARTKLQFDDDNILLRQKVAAAAKKQPGRTSAEPQSKSPPILKSQRQPHPMPVEKHRRYQSLVSPETSDEEDPELVLNKYIKSRRK